MAQINNLITAYQTTGCEASFNAIYAQFSDRFTNAMRKQARLRGIPADEAESEINIEFYEAVKTYDVNIGNFEGYLYKRLYLALAMYSRKETTYQKYAAQVFAEAATSTDNLPELNAIKKEQRQLLDDLYANANEKGRQALIALASTERFSFREAGKLLGISDKTIKNRIEKISATTRNIYLNDYITA